MGKASKAFMGGGAGRQGKVPIKKTINRGGKSFQQTFYVSPQEAMAMQRKAKKEMAEMKGQRAGLKMQKKASMKALKEAETKSLVSAAEFHFNETTIEAWEKKLRTPDKNGNVIPEPPPVREHIEIAKKMVSNHRRAFNDKVNSMKEAVAQIAGPTGKVAARLKTVGSVLGKLQTKPSYGDATTLGDLTGTRTFVNTTDEMYKMAEELQKRFNVEDKDDYLTPVDPKKLAEAEKLAMQYEDYQEFKKKHPKAQKLIQAANVMKPGYRGIHLSARDKDGNVFEIQIRTKDMHSQAEYWLHDVYKPQNKAQKEFLKNPENEKRLHEYSNQITDHIIAKEKDPNHPEPPCPDFAKRSPFGCIELDFERQYAERGY